jgi:GH18 family chitinase
LKELKSIYGGEISTVTGASPYMMDHTPVKEISEVIDYWQIMNYDFFVSDIKSANVTAPN